ncbi:hypothetical protein ASD66_14895 [Nocardioides sp. Root151]|nr:hypothetical protein ASD66_14895 [Nocardioides sp. Root151]
MVPTIPDYVTHYHLPDREPFLNLSELDEPALADVLTELAAVPGSERRFGPRYMALRRATEERLWARFVERGGRPERLSPHYFVLGESAWFRGLYADAREVRLRLEELPREQTSFTVPDSVTSMGLLADFGIEVTPRAHHGEVFLLDELESVAARHGLPDSPSPEDYAGHQHGDFEHYVEVQVWTDRIRK